MNIFKGSDISCGSLQKDKSMRKINVLQFICPFGFYGAEMWILALMKHIYRNEITCSLALTREQKGQNIELHDKVKSLGLESHLIKMNGRFNPMAIIKLATIIKEKKIGIIHTHGYKSDLIGLMAARLAGIKAISTPHGFENSNDFKLQAFIRLGCFSLKYFNCIAPLSDELRHDVVRMRVNPKKIKLIQNGVDLEEIDIEKEKKSPLIYADPDEKKIGYIGQMIFRKNIKDLIKTFDLLYQTYKNIRLILIGDGPMKVALQELAQSLQSSSKIEFLGYRADRLRIMKEFDLFSMTSSLEGIPRCMMEAMAMEVPVAAYRIPGIDKLILHAKTGLMANFGHIEGLKNCWEKLLFDNKLSSNMARNGREHIRENFSAQRMADEYKNLYQKMMKS